MSRLVPLAAVAPLFFITEAANAQYYTTYYTPTTAYYQPATAYYPATAPVTTVAYSPTAAVDNCCCGAAQTATYATTYYAPTTTTTYYAPATPTVVYYPVAPRYTSFYRWW
jgi:hypothetical protein